MWYCQLSRVFFKVAIITLGFQRSDDDTILTEEREWLAQTKSSLQPSLAWPGWLLQISKQKMRSWAGWISWWTPILFLSWRRNTDSAYQFASLWLGNLLVSYQIEISRGCWRRLQSSYFQSVVAGGGSPGSPGSPRVDVPYFVPFPPLPTNYSDMNFPVPDFWQAPLMMLIRDDERSTQC